MKYILIALAALSLSSPAMAWGDRQPPADPAIKEAEHAANEALKDAARCDRALEDYLKGRSNYDTVVFWCGL